MSYKMYTSDTSREKTKGKPYFLIGKKSNVLKYWPVDPIKFY